MLALDSFRFVFVGLYVADAIWSCMLCRWNDAVCCTKVKKYKIHRNPSHTTRTLYRPIGLSKPSYSVLDGNLVVVNRTPRSSTSHHYLNSPVVILSWIRPGSGAACLVMSEREHPAKGKNQIPMHPGLLLPLLTPAMRAQSVQHFLLSGSKVCDYKTQPIR